jgi:galactokinase
VIEAAFASLFGRPPAGVWSAPGRVNLIGEHVDYNDGLVLPLAIERRAVVAMAPREDRQVRVSSVQQPGVVTSHLDQAGVSGWAAYVLGVAWALEEHHREVPGFDLLLDSSIPVGAGLSSSAGVEVATALGLAEIAGHVLSRLGLALVCPRAETGYVAAPVGGMDQVVSACASEGHALLLDCRSLETTHIPVALPEHELVAFDTKVRHDNNDGSYARLRASCERAAELLQVKALRDVEDVADLAALPGDLLPMARHVVTEIARVREAVDALRSADAHRLGRLLLESHHSLAHDAGVCCPELDLVVDAATGAGALGARLTGAGLGGCVLALVPSSSVEAVTASVRSAFQSRGLLVPEAIPVRAASGACRVR